MHRPLLIRALLLTGLMVAGPWPTARAQQPVVEIPKPGVPEIMTIEGNFVRAAYNNEGYVILGYQLANRSIGEPWLLLEVGLTVLEGQPTYDIGPGAFTLTTPDGKELPLPTLEEYRAADLRALQQRERVVRDSINYFPPSANRGCGLVFFPDLNRRELPRDVVEVSSNRACVGRLYFNVPGGIAYGQHWLNVQFARSLIRVPFRILTRDEEKLLSKNYKNIRRQVQDAFRPKK